MMELAYLLRQAIQRCKIYRFRTFLTLMSVGHKGPREVVCISERLRPL